MMLILLFLPLPYVSISLVAHLDPLNVYAVTRVLFVSLTGYDLDVLASEGLFFGRILSSEQLVYLTPPTFLDRYS